MRNRFKKTPKIDNIVAMMSLNDAMKALFYFLVFALVGLSQVFADVCDDAAMDFRSSTSAITSSRMVAYDNLREFARKYAEMKSKISGESCAIDAIEATEADRQIVKEKRIETIQKFLRIGVKEEGGTNIQIEYEYLTGKSKKYKYDFEDVFSNTVGKMPEPVKPYEDITLPKKDPVVIKPNTSPVKTERCSKVDPISNNAVNLDNVRNQDSVGWCYAYTAADLLSLKLNKKISAVSLYNSGQEIANDIRSKTSSNGGDIGESIRSYLAKKGGLCLEEDLPSSDFKFCAVKKYNDFLNNLVNVADSRQFDEELRNNNCFESNLRSAFPTTNISFIRNHINRFGKSKLIEAIYDQQCTKLSFQGIKVNVSTLTTPNRNPQDLMKVISDQLANNEAVGIGYDYNALNGIKEPGEHGSIIVGRQLNPETGSCEYLVRNSWGKNCEQKEGDGLRCHKNCVGDDCRYSGHFWVSEERLQKVISSVTTVK